MVTTFDIEEAPVAGRPTTGRAHPHHRARIISRRWVFRCGRAASLTTNDRFDSAPVVIVNERFAEQVFPGPNPLGKRIKPGLSADDTGEKMREIVGVVGNVKHLSLKNEDSPEMYLPQTQIPFNIMSLVVRTERLESRLR